MTKTKDVREAVEAELSFDPLTDPADIAVRNLNGEVALNGTVPSYPQYALLTTAANNVLAMNITVPDGVEATARDGDLTLTGTVSYGSQRDAAERAVAGLAGVRNVRDDIEIAYDNDLVNVDLHVQEALDRSALVPDDSDVKVDTSGNVVTLTGHVSTWAEHDAVVGAAWMADGVLEVRDDLAITG